MWSVFADGRLWRAAVGLLTEHALRMSAQQVVAVEARGWLLAGAVAAGAGVGVVPVRKDGGLLPEGAGATRTEPDYRGNRSRLRMETARVNGLGVVLVDDWLETGSQARAVRRLVEGGGGTWLGAAVLIDQMGDETRARLGPVEAVVRMAPSPYPPARGGCTIR